MRTPRPSSIVAVTGPAGTVCARCELADGPIRRFLGLMGRRELPPGSGMLLRPTASVHTCFMRFPIDVVFLGRDLEVVDVAPNVRPWRLRLRRRARAVLELPAGAGASLAQGDRLTVVEDGIHGA